MDALTANSFNCIDLFLFTLAGVAIGLDINLFKILFKKGVKRK